MKIITKVAAAALISVSLSGCHIYKSYETPQDSALTKAYAEARAQEVDSTALGNLGWQEVFTDPVLADYINRALVNNTNLRNAQLNVETARAQLLGARLSFLPSLALAPNGAGSKYANNAFSWTYQLPAQASWEIDVFGKLLNSKKRAQAAVLQSEAYAQAVRSQIIAGVATTYYTLAALNTQLTLSRNTSQLWKATVQTMRDMKEAGGVTEAAVMQSEASYYNILASITDIEVNIDKLNNTMSLLLNELPQTWAVSADAALATPPLVDARGGVPMSLLAQRPDVAAAEQNLAMAYYATNSARAAFYPSLTINASGGFTNLLGSFVKNPGDWFVQLAGSLVAPLFSRGANISNLKAQKAQQQVAMNNFEYSLMSASAEVSDALTIYNKSVEKEALLQKQVDDLAKAVDMTQELLRYSTGSTNYLEVLTAQQTLLAAQISLISTRQSRDLAVINLYQSLGGGR